MKLIHRPIDAWPGELLADAQREQSRFSASWTQTLNLLEREVDHLGGREVVLQVAVTEREVRLDGGVRATAKPAHPGVIISFESRHGPLRYSTDRFKGSGSFGYLPGWQANVRAVALGLEALRRVDRYGIAKGGEQYVGWKQLGSGQPTPSAATMTVEEAARLLHAAASPESFQVPWSALIGNSGLIGTAYRLGSKLLHPDNGGDSEAFRRLTEARDLLMGSG